MNRQSAAEAKSVPRSGWRHRRAAVAHDPDAPALSVRDLSVAYGDRTVLREVSFDLPVGAHLAVVGPNAAGKSTLLKAISGLLPWRTGSIEVHGHAPSEHICIAYVPQRSDVDWRFPVTVYDVVMMGRIGRLGPLRRPQARDREQVRNALERVGLSHRAHQLIEELSGGQQQRMFIARAVAQEAGIMLMDEPLAGLDVQSRDGVLALLDQLRGTTLLVALHDLGIASARFDRILLLNGRMLGFGEPATVFRSDLLEQAYGTCLRMVQTEDGVLVVHDTACSGGSE